MQRIDRQPAYILHRRAYRESSLLLELITRDHGRIAAVARSARSGARGSGAACQPFNALLVSWSGRSDLKTLTAVERIGVTPPIAGERLYSALYVNEILIRLLPHHDPHPALFEAYTRLLSGLAGNAELESGLRGFELRLLQELGYGLEFDRDAASGSVLEPEAHYALLPEGGFNRVNPGGARQAYPGWVLGAIGREDFSDPLTLSHAKRLLREALAVLLGDRPLRSREFFLRSRGSTPASGDG